LASAPPLTFSRCVPSQCRLISGHFGMVFGLLGGKRLSVPPESAISLAQNPPGLSGIQNGAPFFLHTQIVIPCR
jgi:hypothetical protein